MDLRQAETLANELMRKHGLFNSIAWKFRWNNRKRAAGICSYGARVIGLSKVLTSFATEAEVRDTILHEIAHALTPGHHHDSVWKAKAIEIGCDGKRCYDHQTKPATAAARAVLGNYKAVCNAGHEHYTFRRKKRTSSCGLCSRKYDPNNILIFLPITENIGIIRI
jgi:predicted SprT family Zn-dependent metalloprotease